MRVVDSRKPKLCFAKPGDAIRLLDEHHQPTGELFLVCAVDAKGKRPARLSSNMGLYDDERPLFMVSFSTGMALPLPHLSSRVEILRDAVVLAHLDGDKP